MLSEEKLKEYFSCDWFGSAKDNPDCICILNFDEIPNFVIHAGLYSDLVIFNSEYTLLDTYGSFVNKILPDLSFSQREEYRDDINQIAGTINEMFDYEEEPIEKVRKFIEEIKMDQDSQMDMQMKM